HRVGADISAWHVAAGLTVELKETGRHNELNGLGTNNTYVYGLDLISVTDRTGAQTYFLNDGLGSTTNLTDGAGTTTASYSYDVFGATRSEGGSAASANEFPLYGRAARPPDQPTVLLPARTLLRHSDRAVPVA